MLKRTNEGWIEDLRFASLAEKVAQETLLRVLDRLDTFEGRSQFTTWVHKIAVRIALTELRRKPWCGSFNRHHPNKEYYNGPQSPSNSGTLR